MAKEIQRNLSRRNALKVIVGGGTLAAIGLVARPFVRFFTLDTPGKIRSNFPEEQLSVVGECEIFETEMGTLYPDLPVRLIYSPEEQKQRIIESKTEPSLIGYMWGEAAGLHTYVTSEDAFYIPFKPKGEENIIPIRVPIPMGISDEQLTKFTDGTFKFDLNTLKWVRMNGLKLERYEIIEEEDKKTFKYTRISEGWVPLKP